MDERWSESEARAVLEQWRRSGDPLAVFARKRGIAAPRLYWWRRKFSFEVAGSGSAMDSPQPVLLPVSVVAEGPERPSEPIEVELRSGHVVRVRAGFDEVTLRRVLALLGEATC